MKIRGLIWLESIIEKLDKKHNVRQQEVREILTGHPVFRFVEKGHLPGENLYAALGQTISGRYIVVFFVYKKHGHALIVSARDMTNAERKQYEKV